MKPNLSLVVFRYGPLPWMNGYARGKIDGVRGNLGGSSLYLIASPTPAPMTLRSERWSNAGTPVAAGPWRIARGHNAMKRPRPAVMTVGAMSRPAVAHRGPES